MDTPKELVGGIVLDMVPVTQQHSLLVEESMTECAVGSGPTNGEVIMHSIAITLILVTPLMMLMLVV